MAYEDSDSFLILNFSPFYAHAWDGMAKGKIVRLESVGGANDGANFDLRVTLSSGGKPCPGTPENQADWIYINANDYNYQGAYALLLLAYTKGREVTLYTRTVAGGFCHIGWVILG